MAEMGWCPSGRLFEAAACGAPLLSDVWEGIGDFFEPGEDIILVDDTHEVLAALETEDSALQRMAGRARERTLDQHSSARRATELVRLLEPSTGERARQLTNQEA
jgi:spore maturation protein CgeB